MITANELKTKGVSAIEKILKVQDEVAITVRGKVKYVVMTVEEYDRKRETELDLAFIETQKDIAAGNFVEESAEEHVNRVWND